MKKYSFRMFADSQSIFPDGHNILMLHMVDWINCTVLIHRIQFNFIVSLFLSFAHSLPFSYTHPSPFIKFVSYIFDWFHSMDRIRLIISICEWVAYHDIVATNIDDILLSYLSSPFSEGNSMCSLKFSACVFVSMIHFLLQDVKTWMEIKSWKTFVMFLCMPKAAYFISINKWKLNK